MYKSYKQKEIKLNLIEAMKEFEIIDSHEHLGPEKERMECETDIFTLFSVYTRGELLTAGMSKEQHGMLYKRKTLLNTDIPLDTRWKIFKPYWERIRWESFSRPILLSIKKFYGIDDINDDTYKPLSEAIQKFNRPGLYKKVLKDACKIHTVLTQGFPNLDDLDETDTDGPVFIPVSRSPMMEFPSTFSKMKNQVFNHGNSISSLDDYVDNIEKHIASIKKRRVVGLKLKAFPYREPVRKKAAGLFNKLKNGVLSSLPHMNAFKDYIIDKTIDFAEKYNLVVAVHTGYVGDYRDVSPLNMVPVIRRHKNVRFDIYHLGFPHVREAMLLAKGKEYPNVWINLCWNHIISQKATVEAMDEAVDLLPVNKIIGFGGDYNVPVENVYGHLVMARENIAEVFSRRIYEKRMSEVQALGIIKKWLWNNPVDLYDLPFHK